MRARSSTQKQDRLFLKAVRGGMKARDVAGRFGVTVKTVYNGIARARLLEQPVGSERLRPPSLVPLFPLTPLTPDSACPHYGPIRHGSIFCCMVCSRSGMDGHRALRRSAATDPKPEPKPALPPPPAKTRKQRRSILQVTRPGRN